MEGIIDQYSNFNKEQIDEFQKIGIDLCLQSEIICFTKYCRNLINFIINNTEFNYLIEFLSQINSEILNDYDSKKQYIKELVNLNNILLSMIQTEDFKTDNFNFLKSDYIILNNYISYLKDLNNMAYYNRIIIIGSDKVDRIYINFMVAKDTISKYEGNNITYLNDIINNFHCLAYKLINYYENNKEIKSLNNIHDIIKNFNNNRNIDYISKSIDNILIIMSDIHEIKPYVESSRRPKLITKEYKKNYEIPLIIAASFTFAIGVVLKLSN